MLTVAALVSWFVLQSPADSPERNVFGLYRGRSFLACAVLTYVALLVLLGRILRLRRGAGFRLVAVHVGLVGAVIALEATAVAGLFDFRQIFGPRPWSIYSQTRENLVRTYSPPNGRWQGTAYPDLCSYLGLEAEEIPLVYETDAYGLRNPRTVEDPAILCLGDSILAAGLLRADQILTERLVSRLGLSVLNVSEGGFAPQESFHRFRMTGLGLEGRLLIQFVFEGNDLADSIAWRTWKESSATGNWPKSGLLSNLLGLLPRQQRDGASRRLGLINRTTATYFLYDGARVRRSMSEMPVVIDFLRETRDLVIEAGGRYAVVFVPMKITALHPLCEWPESSDFRDQSLHTSPMLAALIESCASADIPLFDPTPALRDACADGKIPYFAKDTHLNATGHEVLADALAPWIRTILAR